ncbi:DUF3316 domain-containing protein [Psychromonas hadalis]|uniref:DUF3316 domain-containing protein n=1 Tax=Psychromonas hadalis TaxID=211669 RepID=UPI0003B44448|nr:DUF3316 domain-containing protein [Psychromonas hadalis]
MKNLTPALLLGSTLMMLSGTALADVTFPAGNYTLRNAERHITTKIATTKEQAYNNGYERLVAVKGKKGSALNKELRFWGGASALNRSLHLDNVFVTVTEFMDDSGKMAYQGIVNVKYHYQERSSN